MWTIPPCRCVFIPLFVTLLASMAGGQVQFQRLQKAHLPSGLQGTHALACGDVDGDGDIDIAQGVQFLRARLLLNDGTGKFSDATATRLPAGMDFCEALVMGDVDGDGDLDMILGNCGSYGSQNRLYLNDGKGYFTDVTSLKMPKRSDRTWALALGDLDGDQDLDLVCGNGSQNRLYMNDGKGTFTDVTASNLPVDSDGNLALALGDVDGDGDLDLVCANALTQNRLYINDGKGKFVDTTASTMPTDTDNTDSVVLGDVDGDGDLDLVCGNSIAPGLQNKLYLNDGKGVFGDVTAQRMPKDSDQTDCLALADVDGDRDLDLVCGNRAPTKGAQNRLYLNDGNGTFANAPSSMMPQVEDRTFALVTIDVNQDGDLDLYMGSSVGDSLYFNDGSGHFINTIEQWLYSNITGTNATGVMDLNGDGFPDVVQASGGQNQLHLNDGKGHFTVVTASNMPVSKEGSNSVVMGDLDGDGDVDLVFGCQGQNLLLLNDGKARFIDSTASSLPAGTDWTMELALGDVDGDGDLDFVCGNTGLPGGQNRLYLNNGKAIFSDATATSLPAATDATRAVVLGDIDGDADLDLICGNTGQNRVYINNGKGLFVDQTSARLPLGTDNTDGLALLDVDLDGDLDLLVANTGQNKLYLNDAKGVFADVTATRLPVDSDPSWAFAMGDVDGDGDVDLFVGNHGFCRVYLNDGKGGFTDGTSRMLPAGCSNEDAPALADADGDGDCDLLAGGGLYFNLLRQVHAPYLAILGADYRLDLHALPGFPTTGNVALPFIALAEKRVSIPPFGTLWLDFQFMVQLNPVVIPATTGMTSIDFRIPNDPKLQGLHLSSQALILYGPGLFRLSNANSDPIMRV